MAVLTDVFDIPCRYDLGYEEGRRQEQEALDRHAEAARAVEKGDLVGETIRFSVADGYAEYMVLKEEPLSLAHIASGDGYTVHPALIRGLILSDVQEMVERERSFKSILDRRGA
jgi:hypothetical protein